MIRKRTRKIIEILNPALLVAPIIPLLYCFGFVDETRISYELFFISLLIIIPLVAIDYFERKCKHLILYLIGGISTLAITVAIGFLLGPVLYKSYDMIGVPIVLGIEGVFILGFHFKVRLVYAQQLEDEGRITEAVVKGGLLTKPSLYALILFGAYYYIAMGFKSKIVCNEVLLTSIVYIFICLIDEFLRSTEEYLNIHHDVSDIPKKRVYGIGSGMLGCFMLILLLLIIPSVAAINYRPYYELSEVLNNDSYDEEIPEYEVNNFQNNDDENIYDQLAQVEPFEWPEWVKMLSKVFLAGIFLIVVVMILKAIKNIFDTFKISYEENGDIVENLTDNDKDIIIDTNVINKEADTEAKKIRRLYKKTIRKAMKEKPEVYETPTEIEKKAGLFNKPEMIELHAKYEKVRYGK